MRMTLGRASLPLVAIATSLLAANLTWAQEQEYAKRLRSPATTRGFVGGESHDGYVIRARKGQVMTVTISWRHEHDKAWDVPSRPPDEAGDNHAEFWVGELPNADGDGYVKFGKQSNKGKRWSGKIPRTGDYYIYVNANPTARYTLRVTVE